MIKIGAQFFSIHEIEDLYASSPYEFFSKIKKRRRARKNKHKPRIKKRKEGKNV